jgi:hypothetical protein
MRRVLRLGLIALAGAGAATVAAGAAALSPVKFFVPGTKAISNPAAALDPQGRLFLAWVQGADGQHDAVHVARVEPGAATIEAPVRVTAADEVVGSRHLAPGLAVGPGGEIYVTWSARPPGGAGSDVRLARSLDGGRTFGAAVTVNDDGQPVSRGFESVTVAPDGNVHVGWIDGRDRQQRADAVSTYVARSRDRGATFGRNVRADERTCVCCRVGLSAGADGSLYVGLRQVNGGVRDIAVARSGDGGATFAAPVLVHQDNWQISACPHRGPSLGQDRGGRVYVAWYTEGTEAPTIHLATSDDRGRTFTRPHSLGYPRGTFPDAPVMAVTPAGRAYVAWYESSPVVSRVFMRQVAERGTGLGAPQLVSEGAHRSHHPVVALGGGRLAVAWAQDNYAASRIAFRLLSLE